MAIHEPYLVVRAFLMHVLGLEIPIHNKCPTVFRSEDIIVRCRDTPITDRPSADVLTLIAHSEKDCNLPLAEGMPDRRGPARLSVECRIYVQSHSILGA
jgi:hypothetical protein